ncbi:MAG: ribonuclease III [Vulcanimicrobiaceae bacterium]
MAGESRRRRLRALLALAEVPNVDPAAFDEAFVHESAVKEARAQRSNQRLEFVGDAVLGYAVARWLFERYPQAPEGELALRKSSLVADAALAETAEQLGFEPLLLLGQGMANLPAGRHRSALADAFEAFLAALERTCGFEVAARFVERRHIAEREKLALSLDDPKTVLQEWSQKHYTVTPDYTERADGPAHERTFFAQVAINGEFLADGSGPSKKAAQRAAAQRALEILREHHDDLGPRQLSAPAPRASRPRMTRKGTQRKRTPAAKQSRT